MHSCRLHGKRRTIAKKQTAHISTRGPERTHCAHGDSNLAHQQVFLQMVQSLEGKPMSHGSEFTWQLHNIAYQRIRQQKHKYRLGKTPCVGNRFEQHLCPITRSNDSRTTECIAYMVDCLRTMLASVVNVEKTRSPAASRCLSSRSKLGGLSARQR